jgi:hypothetical protein
MYCVVLPGPTRDHDPLRRGLLGPPLARMSQGQGSVYTAHPRAPNAPSWIARQLAACVEFFIEQPPSDGRHHSSESPDLCTRQCICVCRLKCLSMQVENSTAMTTSQQRRRQSMHPLGATWNQMGINRRSKQLANADKERITKGQWTHLRRALPSSQA